MAWPSRLPMGAIPVLPPPSPHSLLSKSTKRSRSHSHTHHSTSHASSSSVLHTSFSPSVTAYDDEDFIYTSPADIQTRHPRHSYPPCPMPTLPSFSHSTSSPTSSSSSPFFSHASTPSISPVSPPLPHYSALMSRRSSSSSSSSSTSSIEAVFDSTSVAGLKRLAISDEEREREGEVEGRRSRRKVDADTSLLISFSSFNLSAPHPIVSPSSRTSAVPRVIVKGKRASAPVGPAPAPRTPVKASALPPSFSVTVSPAPALDVPGILSTSLPSTSSFFLSHLLSSASSSSSSPLHSPTSAAQLQAASALPTPSSASSTGGHRPRLMSPQERAALFPSRSVSSSPSLQAQSLDSSSASRRVATGKRQGVDSPSSASSYRTASASSAQPRGSKRVKEDRRRDRRCSFGYTPDDGARQHSSERQDSTSSPSPLSASCLTLLMASPSSSSLSSLDSPSCSSAYPSALAPLNSPVSGGLRRRLCHIEQHDLLGTAAAAASVARRGELAGLYGAEEEGDLIDAVQGCKLDDEHQQTAATTAGDDDVDDGRPRVLPTAPRLATRSTSLRVSVTPAPLFPAASDDEELPADEEVLVVLSPIKGRGASAASAVDGGFSEFIRTGSFSAALRSARQQKAQTQRWISPHPSSASGSSLPATPEPVLSPLSASLLAPPVAVSPAASVSESSTASVATSAGANAQPPLSPFTLLPIPPTMFPRSLSVGVEAAHRAHRGDGGWHPKGSRAYAGSGRRGREGEGEGHADDVVPFLKELSLPPRGDSGEAGGGMLARFRATRAGKMEVVTTSDM